MMEKKLPNVYANPIGKKLQNVQEMYYEGDRNFPKKMDQRSVEQKINSIFSSREFVYKSHVRITTNQGIKECIVVGKTDRSLLTLDNETITIASIIDIEKI